MTGEEELVLAPGEALALRYRIVVADGAWERDRVEGYAGHRPIG